MTATSGGPLSAERLAGIERQHRTDAPLRRRVSQTRDTNATDLSEAFFFADHARAVLLAEVGRLSEENGWLRERIEAALEIDPKPMVGLLADLDFAAGFADGFNDCRSKFRSALLSGVPGEAGKE